MIREHSPRWPYTQMRTNSRQFTLLDPETPRVPAETASVTLNLPTSQDSRVWPRATSKRYVNWPLAMLGANTLLGCAE
jgi:hypothetical protein